MLMAHRYALECANERLRAITGKDEQFGGEIFFGIGDFRQTAPIVCYAGKTLTIEASINSSPLWSSYSVLCLNQPVRNTSDTKYALWVDEIGQGSVTRDENDISLDMITDVDDLQDAIHFLYPLEMFAAPEESM